LVDQTADLAPIIWSDADKLDQSNTGNDVIKTFLGECLIQGKPEHRESKFRFSFLVIMFFL